MLKDNIETLKTIPLFTNIKEDELLGVLSCIKGTIKQFKKGEIIGLTGDEFLHFGIIISGSVTVSKDGYDGSRLIISVLGKSDMFGEIVAFTKNPILPANLISNEKSEILFIPKDKIVSSCKSVCSFHTTLSNNMLRIIATKAFMLNKKIEYLSIKSMRGKLSAYLLELYKQQGASTISLPINRNELADFLNVSRPSMSRELARLKDEGIIDYYLSTVRILNLNELKKYVN